MEIKITNSVSLELETKLNVSLQNGSIPSGLTSAGSKFPINTSGVSIYDPNDAYGPTYTPYIPVERVFQDYRVQIDGDWSGKIKPGDALQLSRGNINSEYYVQKVLLDAINTKTTISFSTYRSSVSLLTPFIGSTGYPGASNDTYLEPGRKLELTTGYSNLLRDFYLILRDDPDRVDSFTATAYWSLDPKASATRLRWRSEPRNTTVSTLSFTVTGALGIYTQMPAASLISNTGRSGVIQLKGRILGASIVTGGTGYTTAYALAVGGGGTGASFSVTRSGTTVTGINIVNGGTGYSSVPSIIIYGNGTGASARVATMRPNTVSVVQQGGGYLTGPTVSVDSTYRVGSINTIVSSQVSLTNTGRVDYIRILNGGSGYTGASVTITGGMVDATATAVVKDGSISNIILTSEGYGYTGAGASVTITPSGASGSGAIAVANIDMYSSWVYEDPETTASSKTIYGLKYNIPYEIEILVSEDPNFRGVMKYGNTLNFQYYKNLR